MSFNKAPPVDRPSRYARLVTATGNMNAQYTASSLEKAAATHTQHHQDVLAIKAHATAKALAPVRGTLDFLLGAGISSTQKAKMKSDAKELHDSVFKKSKGGLVNTSLALTELCGKQVHLVGKQLAHLAKANGLIGNLSGGIALASLAAGVGIGTLAGSILGATLGLVYQLRPLQGGAVGAGLGATAGMMLGSGVSTAVSGVFLTLPGMGTNYLNAKIKRAIANHAEKKVDASIAATLAQTPV